MTLIDIENMTMTLDGYPKPVPVINDNGGTDYQQIAGDSEIVETTLTIQGEGEIIWPNREGERFSLMSAHKKLKALNRQNSGISLCWPATASVQAMGVIDGDTLYTFYTDPDARGRTRFLELRAEEPGLVSFNFKGTSVSWKLLLIPISDIKKSYGKRKNPASEASLYQLGLIGPAGECEDPENRGFAILEDAAHVLINKFGPPLPGDIIHVFGYAAGHDIGYPDYTPSSKLGGKPAFKSAIEEIRKLGFEVSLYMNARLAERALLSSYPNLESSILTDIKGQQVIEAYRGRDFAVMNPSSTNWINHILSEVNRLKNLGITWIQLDQIAGRAAPVSPGDIWGKGYRKLIEEIRSMGLKVWIQGVSDYYPADAFEATWRAVDVLDDGTLRGGFPMGVPDTKLMESLGFNSPLIVPEKKRKSLENSSFIMIHDRCAVDDELPMWGASWLDNLEKMQSPRCGGHKKL